MVGRTRIFSKQASKQDRVSLPFFRQVKNYIKENLEAYSI